MIKNMAEENIIEIKSYAFAIRIVNAYKYLVEDQKEYVLSKQLLRCGTSIGANVAEAVGSQTDKEFNSKFYISYKEARETQYWIKLLADTSYFSVTQRDSLLVDVEELLKILGSILKTMKGKLEKKEE
jgi:four helix bundle protein